MAPFPFLFDDTFGTTLVDSFFPYLFRPPRCMNLWEIDKHFLLPRPLYGSSCTRRSCKDADQDENVESANSCSERRDETENANEIAVKKNCPSNDSPIAAPASTPSTSGKSLMLWSPKFRVEKPSEEELLVKAELPEVNKENIRVDLDGNDSEGWHLRINARRQYQQDTEHSKQTFWGSVTRVVPLPSNAIPKDISPAKFENGVLTLTVPLKKSEAPPLSAEVLTENSST